MKKLTCEICGSTDLVKQEDCFVCQLCGCKYSVEAARKMIMEGAVEEHVTVKIDASNQIKPLLQRAEFALANGDFYAAHDFTEQVLNLDAECGKAYLIKLLCILQVVDLNQIILKKENLVRGIFSEEAVEKEFTPIYNQALKYLDDDLKEVLQNAFEALQLEKVALENKKLSLVVEALNQCKEPKSLMSLICSQRANLLPLANRKGVISSPYVLSLLNRLMQEKRVIRFEGKRAGFWTLEGANNGICSLIKNAKTLEDLKEPEQLARMLGKYQDVQEYFDKIAAKRDRIKEKERKKEEEAEKLLREKQLEEERIRKEREEKKQEYRTAGVCQYCGGVFKGLFTKTCSSCGIKKDY